MIESDRHFMRKNKKGKASFFSTSLPSLYIKCNADLDYESVTDVPDWIVKVPFLLIRCTFSGEILTPLK